MPSILGAQFAQYTAPGSPGGRIESRRENLEEAAEDARFRLGPVRVEPWVGLRNVGYVDNVFGAEEDPQSDLTATAGAGLRAYLRTGPKVIWAAHALPEYVWWQDLDEQRRTNGRYGLGMFGFWNRLTVEALATRAEELAIVTHEVPQRINARTERASLGAELELGRALFAFASASVLETANLADEAPAPGFAPFDRLDRREEVARAGLRWRSPGAGRFWLGLGAESSAVDFADGARALSNSGVAPLVEGGYEGRRLFAAAELADRSLEPEAAEFLPYDGVTGRLRLGWSRGRTELWLYGSRDLVYSLSVDAPWFEQDLAGASVGRKLGWRTAARVFVEQGRAEYASPPAGGLGRLDDLTALGGEVVLELWSSADLVIGAVRTDYKSNVAGFDRDVTEVRTGISFGGPGEWY